MEALMAGTAARIVIIGAGHNGLLAALQLAKAGYKPVVLERRLQIGGVAAVEEIHPGFRCPALLHVTGPMPADEGFPLLSPIIALDSAGRALRIDADPLKTAAGLAAFSEHDARVYPEFQRCFQRLGAALRPLLSMTPPNVDRLQLRDYLNFGRFGLKFRGLDRRDAYRLLRYAPMPVGDIASEWFENELLRAVVAARGIFGSFAGPSSPGSGSALLTQSALGGDALLMGEPVGVLAERLATKASAAGARIRTGADVTAIRVRDGRVNGVTLETGEEIAADVIVSGVDPRQTFLALLDESDLDPKFLANVRSYRSMGVVAKVNLALSSLPSFAGMEAAPPDWARGRIHIGPDVGYVERAFDAAKYGAFSEQPYLDICIPSVADPSLAPGGSHVMSILVQYAPYQLKASDWTSRRDELGDVVVKTIGAYAPAIKELVVGRQVITPQDMERIYGLNGGHLFHGEHALDQLFAFRPFFGWAQYRTPVRGLYLCGAGTHPGGGVTGLPGMNASREIVRDLRLL